MFVIDYQGEPFTQLDVLQESWGAYLKDNRTLSLQYSEEPFERLATRQMLHLELRTTGGDLPQIEEIWYGIRNESGEERAEWKVVRGRIAVQDWNLYGVTSATVDLELEDGLRVRSKFWFNFAPREE